MSSVNLDLEVLPNLASPLLGASIVFVTDEWFASADNLLKDADPIWRNDDYTPYGKWMDGWESRRRRTEGHDWCIVQLGMPGIITAIEIDTAFFTGNFSPKVSVTGAFLSPDSEIVSNLIRLRGDGEERIGTKATDEEQKLVDQLHSEAWSVVLSTVGIISLSILFSL